MYLEFKEFLKNELPKYRVANKRVVFLMAEMIEGSASDDEHCIKMVKKYNKKIINNALRRQIDIVYAKSTDEWLSYIKNASILVSGRFHHSIAAFCFGVPYVCFDGNSPKTKLLIDDLTDSKTQLEHIQHLAELNFLPFNKTAT